MIAYIKKDRRDTYYGHKICLTGGASNLILGGAFRRDLPGNHEMWGVTAFFHYFFDPLQRENYRFFREQSRRQGLPLLTFELARRADDFLLVEPDAEILIQIESDQPLWQKEALYNMSLHYLPESTKKICFLDADIVFENGDWLAETAGLLEHHDFVWPFSDCTRLNSEDSVRLKRSRLDLPELPSTSKAAFSRGLRKIWPAGLGKLRAGNSNSIGCTGFGLAVRRGFLVQVGFYDKMILGGGDLPIPDVLSRNLGLITCRGLCRDWRDDLFKWRRKLETSSFTKASFTDGRIFHLWHGDLTFRFYGVRYLLARLVRLNVLRDLRKNSLGIWEWKQRRFLKRKAVESYFWLRAENRSTFQICVRWVLARTQQTAKFIRDRLKIFQPKTFRNETRLQREPGDLSRDAVPAESVTPAVHDHFSSQWPIGE